MYTIDFTYHIQWHWAACNVFLFVPASSSQRAPNKLSSLEYNAIFRLPDVHYILSQDRPAIDVKLQSYQFSTKGLGSLGSLEHTGGCQRPSGGQNNRLSSPSMSDIVILLLREVEHKLTNYFLITIFVAQVISSLKRTHPKFIYIMKNYFHKITADSYRNFVCNTMCAYTHKINEFLTKCYGALWRGVTRYKLKLFMCRFCSVWDDIAKAVTMFSVSFSWVILVMLRKLFVIPEQAT